MLGACLHSSSLPSSAAVADPSSQGLSDGVLVECKESNEGETRRGRLMVLYWNQEVATQNPLLGRQNIWPPSLQCFEAQTSQYI